MKRLLLTTMTVLLLLGAGVAWSGNYEDGVAASERSDYATALRLWRPLAEKGLAAAQNDLGMIYLKGHGVAHNDAEAEKWFRLAATQGFAEGQLNLGAMYAEGLAVAQDYGEAAEWFRMAAEQGNAKAQFNLGLIYMS